jgi:C4-dicarboxylate-binding protein DctP
VRSKILLISVALVLVAGLVATGCAATPEEAEKVTWHFGNTDPPAWNTEIDSGMCDRIREATNGNFDIKYYLSDELGVERSALPGLLKQGVVQVSVMVGGHIAGEYPALGVFGLPFLQCSINGCVEDGTAIEEAIRSVVEAEWAKDGIGRLGFATMTPVGVVSETPIDDLSDWKGLKCRAWDENTANIVAALNGEPVIMGVTETYVAMQRGVIDAVLTGVPAMVSMALYEPGAYLYTIGLAPANIYTGYNLAAEAALPQEFKDALWDAAKWHDEEFQRQQPIADKVSLDDMAAGGVEIIQPDAATLANMQTKVKPLWETWAAQGPAEKQAYDLALKALGLA